jgi:biotin transport system substrate-specific component
MTAQSRYSTLGERVVGSSALSRVFLVVLSSLVLTASAKIQVPFYPVPMTMQTMVVLGLGYLLGARLGAAAILVYLAEGAVGLPVFAGTPEKGIGLAYMMGPTGGYLLGFILAAWFTGMLAERGWDRSMATTALASIAGLTVLYIPGLLWLGAVLGWDKPILGWGLWPFLPGEALKVALLCVGLPLAWRAVKLR